MLIDLLEIQRHRLNWKIKEIWFAEAPTDVSECDSVWFRSCPQKVDAKDFNCEMNHTLQIDLSQSLPTLWKNVRGNSRRGVEDAKKRNVAILKNQRYDEFYEMYTSFRRRKRLPKYWGLDLIKKYGTLFLAELNGKILSGILYLEDSVCMRALLIASTRFEGDKDYARLVSDAQRLLIWESIEYASRKAIRTFDLGGYYTGQRKNEEAEGVNAFKRSFGGKVTTLYDYTKDYDPLLGLARWIYKRRSTLSTLTKGE